MMKTMMLSSLMLLATMPSARAQAPRLIPFPKGSNQTHRSNVCDRFLEYANGQANIRDALKGLNLTVGVVDQLNDVYIHFNEDGTLMDEDPGIFVVVLDELARRGGFNWRDNYGVVYPPNGTNPETDVTYNWTDVLHEAVLNYDFSFAEWVHNQERRVRGISFPVGWYDASTILVQSRVRNVVQFSVTAFLRPFSNRVWGMIVGVFIVSGMLYWMIDKIANWGTDNEVNSILYDMFLATMTFTQHHMYWDPSGHGKRIFAFSASFWSLVLASAYTANLASFLVSQGAPAEIATSLAEVEALQITLCVRANAAVEVDLRNRYPQLTLKTSEDFEGVYQDLIDGNCELLATRPFDFDQFRNNKDINPECTLKWVGRQDNAHKGGPATLVDTKNYCTSLITHVLEIHMNEMLDDHFVDLAWQAHLRNQYSHQCPPKEADSSKDVDGQYSLTVLEVGGIFVFHAGLGLVSILVALVEMWWKRRHERALLQAAVKDPQGMEAHVEQIKPKPRPSTNVSAMAHYQSSMALQGIINDRASGRKSQNSPSNGMQGGRTGGGRGSFQEDDLDFNEDILGTISSLQSEMEKLQNYVVEKRNKQSEVGMLGA